MLDAAKAASGIQTLAVFAALCSTYADEARREIGYRVTGGQGREPAVERNLSPLVAAGRLGISLRKLTRERFTVYRSICVPLDGQTRGYVVNEHALGVLLERQRAGR